MKKTRYLIFFALGVSLLISATTTGTSRIQLAAASTGQTMPLVTTPDYPGLDTFTCTECHDINSDPGVINKTTWIDFPAYGAIHSQILANSGSSHHEHDQPDAIINAEAIYTILEGEIDTNSYEGPIVQCAFCHTDPVENAFLPSLVTD